MRATAIKNQHVGIFDPLDLIKALNPAEVILLESADVVTKMGEKSMVLLDLALKIEARNDYVELHVLDEEARTLLSVLKEQFAHSVVEAQENYLKLRFADLFDELDILQKMRKPSKLDVLRAILKAIEIDQSLSDMLMVAGVFSYDFLDHFERLPKSKTDRVSFPDFLFYVPLSIAIIDHPQQVSSIVSWSLAADRQENASVRAQNLAVLVKDAIKRYSSPKGSKTITSIDKTRFETDVNDHDFARMIEQCKEHINAGDVYQIVPSRTFSRPIADALVSYRALRSLNPSPHMFYVKTSEWTLFGASPETFIRVDQGGRRVAIRPIAGTRRRGLKPDGHIDPELDAREQVSLCLDEKELAEHMMLVDLARNDIASVARPASRRIRRLLGVDRFSHVMHLVSEVEGEIRPGYDAFSAYQASMNMGTLMGAPKVRAAELLRELEHSKRGFYGGAVGYVNKAGDMDTAIIIRSALVKGGMAYVRAGCGVVYDSLTEFEVQETLNKAEAVLKALELSESL